MKIIQPFIFGLILFSACHSSKPTSSNIEMGSEKLFASKWILAELNGKNVIAAKDDKGAELAFFPGQVSRVSGSTGCNRLNGNFELEAPNKIKFSPLAVTKMMCPEAASNEAAFLDALSRANNYYFTNGDLMLLNGKILLARFKPAAVS